MATKTAKAAEEKSGLSKREEAIAANAARSKTTQTDRRPKAEQQYYYVKNARGNLALRSRMVKINQDAPGI
jgi:hypothetical protein